MSEQPLRAGEVLAVEGPDPGQDDLYVCEVKEVFGRTFALAAPIPTMVWIEYLPDGQVAPVPEAEMALLQQLMGVGDGR